MQKQWIYLVLGILVSAPMLGACERIEKAKQIYQAVDKALNEKTSNTAVWDEEVRLHDGRVIVIKRREVKTGGGFPINSMNSRGITRSYEFCYPPMGLYWKSKGDPRYQPEILDIVDGKAYVKVPISGFEACMFHNYPATNAIYFTWENDAWKKIPYEQFPKEVRRINLLQGAWGASPETDAHGLVTQAEKERRDSIYWDIKHSPLHLESITDFPDMRGECERYRGGGQTTSTPDVFLPPTTDICQQPNQGGNTP